MSDARDVHTEPGADWLSVADAAAQLGITSRSVQRRCTAGTLAARIVSTSSGQRWEIDPAALEGATRHERRDANDTSDATRQTTVTSSKRRKRQGAPHRDATQTTRATSQDASGGELGALPPLAVALIETQAGEIAHLRAQIEQHARAEAELRAALREALKIGAKALPVSGAQESATAPPPVPVSGAQRVEVAEATPAASGAQDAQRGAQSGEPGKESLTHIGAQTGQPAATGDTPAPWYPEKREGFLQRAKIWLFGG